MGTPERHLFIEDPDTAAERLALAQRCEEDMELGFPMLVDGLDDAVNTAYAAWPERLYLVDLDGTIAYRGGVGPDDFVPDQLGKVIERCSEAWARGEPAGEAAKLPPRKRGPAAGRVSQPESRGTGEEAKTPPGVRLPALNNEAAWRRMNHTKRTTSALALWARIQADSLPRTTASELALDALHRVRNPLGPLLAAKLRFVVGAANRCAYAQEAARADLVRAGVSADDLRLLEHLESQPESERVALTFARKLTLTASALTDAEFAELVRVHGVDDAVAIVLTVAHANFQDRVFLAMGLTSEPGGPALPVEAASAADVSGSAPARTAPADPGDEVAAREGGWGTRTADELRLAVERQNALAPRLPSPDAAHLAALTDSERERVAMLGSGALDLGYQPQLTRAWLEATDAFEREARLDEVLASSLLWVVSATDECAYGTSLAEARLSATLSADELRARLEHLVQGDAAEFSHGERSAFAFAHELAAEPWNVGADELQALSDAFGRQRALDLVWHSAWADATARVASAFQLPPKAASSLESKKP